tara:strand:- start:327 stop:1457 length:1131 start_codon:yes stop_codon:yes gene_type:complete
MRKIYYWSPCLGKVGTIKSTLNSAYSLKKFDFNNNKVVIINSCGEWDNYKNEIENNNVEIVDLGFKYFKFLPVKGVIQSRISYAIIFLLSFFPLISLIKKNKPDFIIAHLITSLPLFLNNILSDKFKCILRISGYPKLHFVRKIFWQVFSKKIFKITCPTQELFKQMINNGFQKEKLFFLPDAIIDIKKVLKYKNSLIKKKNDKKYILSVGRLTKQKNYPYLINEIANFFKLNNTYDLYIVGDGEEKIKLEKQIKSLNMENRIFILGYSNEVYSYMKNASFLILASLWEEVGFVIVEAAVNNLFVFSSDCPNGPKEFLRDGKAGILFRTNVTDELKNKLINFNINDFPSSKILAKKNSIKYTKFRHYLKLQEVLSN